MSRTENCRETPFTSFACAGSHVGLWAVDMVDYRFARDKLRSFRYEDGRVSQEMSGRQDESKGTKMFV